MTGVSSSDDAAASEPDSSAVAASPAPRSEEVPHRSTTSGSAAGAAAAEAECRRRCGCSLSAGTAASASAAAALAILAMPTDWERLRVMRDFGSLSARSEALDWLRGTPAVTAGVAGVTGRLSPLAARPLLAFDFGAGVAAAVWPVSLAPLVPTAFGIVKLAASYSLPHLRGRNE